MSKVAKWIFPIAGGKEGIIGTATAVVGFMTGNWGMVASGIAQVAGAGKKSQAQARQASILQLSLGETPREAVLGMTATGGSLVDVFNFGGQYGTDKVTRCVALADHAIDGIEGFYVNDVYYPWTNEGQQAVFSNKLSFHFRNATPDGYDPPQHVQQYGGWTVTDRMAGITHIWIDWYVDDKVWPQGHPEFRFVLRGLRAFDPRFDPALGYTGPNPQTWEDRSSHKFTRNAKVLRYAYTRGIYAEGHQGDPDYLLIGRGLTADEAPPELVIADANLCDEIVDGLPRYRVDAVVSASQPYIEVDGLFAAAMAGEVIQRQGTVEVEAGQAKAVVVTITDDDLVEGEPVKFSDFLPDNDGGRVNTVIGRYIEPSLGYRDHSAPVRRSLADIQSDKGPREQTISLPFVTDAGQVGRIIEIRRLMSRLEKRASIVLPPKFAGLEEGDWIAWQSKRRHGGATRRYRIETYRQPETWRMYLTLREIASSVFGIPDPVEDTTAPPPPPQVIDALQLFGVEAEPITLAGESSTIPAIRFKWTAPVDAAVQAIRAEVRRDGETEAAPTRTEGVDAGIMVATNGVGPDQVLQCRLVPIGDPSRPVVPSAWISVSTSGLVAGDVSLTAPTIVAMQDAIDLAEEGLGSINSAVASLNATIYTAGTGLKGRSDAMFASLNTPTTGVLARLTATETAISTNNSAAVDRLNALEATVNTAGTGLTARLATAESAITANNNAATSRLSALEATVNTAGTGLSARVAGLQTAVSDLNTGKANASDLTTLQAEVTTARGGAASLNTRLNTVESNVAGKASASSVAALEAAVNAPGTGLLARAGAAETAIVNLQTGKADATRVSVLEARATPSPNLLVNSGFLQGLTGWTIPSGGYMGLIDAADTGRALIIQGSGDQYVASAPFRVRPNVALSLSFDGDGGDNAANGGGVYLVVNADNGGVPGSTLADGFLFTPFTSNRSWQVRKFSTAPLATPGAAAWARVVILKSAATPYVALTRIKVNEGAAAYWSDDATLLSANSRIASLETATTNLQTGKADASRVTSLEATINTAGTGVSARLTTVEGVAASADGRAKAIKGVVLDVNGYVSGYSSTNDGTSAAFEVSADKFGIRAPGSGERTEYRAGNWYVYSPSENTRTRYGKAFGGDQKLVWWTGPTSVAEGSETKGNAYVYMSQNTVGGPRFGGSDVIGPGGTLTATANTGFIGGGRSGAGYVNTSNQVTVTVSGGTSGATIRWTRISGDSRIQMNNATAFTTGAYATIGAGEVISAYFMGSITKGGQSAVVYVQVDLSDNGT